MSTTVTTETGIVVDLHPRCSLYEMRALWADVIHAETGRRDAFASLEAALAGDDRDAQHAARFGLIEAESLLERLLGHTLLLCWTGKPHALQARAAWLAKGYADRRDPRLDSGEDVIRELVEAGWEASEIRQAGDAALTLIRDRVMPGPAPEEVKRKAEVFPQDGAETT